MSKLFENKQYLHIAAETIAIAGVFYYLNKQTKLLSTQISQLNKRLEDCEEIIAQQSQLIRQLAPKLQQAPPPVAKPKPLPQKAAEPSFAIVLPPPSEPQVKIVPPEVEEEQLDEEIKEELSELNLKKEE